MFFLGCVRCEGNVLSIGFQVVNRFFLPCFQVGLVGRAWAAFWKSPHLAALVGLGLGSGVRVLGFWVERSRVRGEFIGVE